MSCPFFVPLARSSRAISGSKHWPLGVAWEGRCRAGDFPPIEDLQVLRWCNFGYAAECPRLPADRRADKVSFGIGRIDENRVTVQYVFEREHLPVEFGHLLYDRSRGEWLRKSQDQGLQRQAECFLEPRLLAWSLTNSPSASGANINPAMIARIRTAQTKKSKEPK